MQKSKGLDYIFLFIVLALSAIGMLMVFSASPTMGIKHGDVFYYIKRHFFFLLLGAGALFYGLHLDLEKVKEKAVPLLGFSIILLLLVFIPGVGRKISGASRWIDLGLLSFQPSELIKFTFIFFLAKWLADNQAHLKSFARGILLPLSGFGAIALLIIAQPDLGTAIVLGSATFSMLFVAGANIRHLAGLGVAGVIGIIGLGVTSPYRLKRFVAYLDPWQDPQGAGFHIIQSLLAVGSGGILGMGLGASRQKYFYLPQQFTDFIFAILCEELGLIGGAAVVILFTLFALRGFRIAAAAPNLFQSYLVAGLVSWLTLQALINIMVVVGLLPTTGIPLPFISFGGTATMINLFSVGVILNVSKK